MSDDEGFAGDLFGNCDDVIAPKPEPTYEVYVRNKRCASDDQLKIRLVGSHPLWAHHLWNASKVFAKLFDDNPTLCQGKTVLELGAGGALPSIVAALNGASRVVITDYPDADLLENIQANVDSNLPPDVANRVSIEGFVWGTNTEHLQREAGQPTFDVIILSDLVFNHSQHHAMLRTCRHLLTPVTGRVYVFYSHHRPHLAHRDNEFFAIAARPEQKNVDPEDRDTLGYGFKTDHFLQEKMHVMFEDDPGDEQVRATVHGWQMWLS